MDDLQRHYLKVMGIQAWELREAQEEQAAEASAVTPESEPLALQSVPAQSTAVAATAPPRPESLPETAAPDDVAVLDWPALQQRVAACTACDELVASRSQTVFGVGNPKAELLVIGEAPGADEDRQGEPFVGRAGQLLNAMLAAIGLQRGEVYIANVLKCRPPNNRDPKPDEAAACAAYLQRQIALIQPKVILVVGRIAAQNLLHIDTPIGKLRGSVHRLDNGVPVVVTYHPAYLLRSPQEKRKAWADLCLARSTLHSAQEGGA